MSNLNGKYSLGISYTHFQNEYSESWLINHNLGVKPTVQVYVLRSGIAYERILPKDIEIIDTEHVVVHFSIPMIGKVILT